MSTIRVGVLRGGPSDEYDVSLKTGASVLKNLPEKYKPVDILLSKERVWHANGIPQTAAQVFRSVEVVFNALHGAYGEDGKIQQLFEAHDVRYTGSGPLGSALGMNKIMAQDVYRNAGLRATQHFVADVRHHEPEALSRMIARRLSPPWVVKPPSGGSSIGIEIARIPSALVYYLEKLFLSGETKVLVEQMIFGREATCGVIEDFRGHRYYALPPVEIIPPAGRSFFDYQSKYDGNTREIVPGNFSTEERAAIRDAAIRAHRALGLRHYSRSDFIVTKQGPYILETNTLPGLTNESLFPKSLAAVGATYPDFLDHMITLALNRA